MRFSGLYMAIGRALGSASAAGGERSPGVPNPNFHPARQQQQGARTRAVPGPVQQHRQAPDWMSYLPEATKSNGHFLTIWPALEFEDETPAE